MTTVLHNKACSTSRAALETASDAGVDVEIHDYLKQPLSAEQLRELIGKLEDPVTDLVRRDPYFKGLGLSDADVQSEDQVIALLVEHPRLMQRPVLVKVDRAIIGRPKDRVAPFLAD